MNHLIDLAAYRPGRNFIRLGDTVRCRPLHGRSFDAVVKRIRADAASGQVVEVSVVGGAGGRRHWRTFTPDRISRRVQNAVRSQARA